MSGSTTASAAGLGLYSIGTELVIAYPRTVFYWSFYTSPITNVGGPNKALDSFLQASGIRFNPEPYGVAPGSIQGVPGTIGVNNYNGAQAVLAEVERIQTAFGSKINGGILIQNASPGMVNNAGNARNMDISFQTRTFISGATNNYGEVKTGEVKFTGTTGGTARVQALADAANLPSRNNAVAGVRTLGQGLRLGGAALGVAGAGYDVYSTGTTIYGQLQANDTSGAVLTGAQFGGRWAGMMAGAWTFGQLGAVVGTVAPGPGNLIGGGVGMAVGGVIGAFGGEAGVNYIAGKLSVTGTGNASQAGQPSPGPNVTVTAPANFQWGGASGPLSPGFYTFTNATIQGYGNGSYLGPGNATLINPDILSSVPNDTSSSTGAGAGATSPLASPLTDTTYGLQPPLAKPAPIYPDTQPYTPPSIQTSYPNPFASAPQPFTTPYGIGSSTGAPSSDTTPSQDNIPTMVIRPSDNNSTDQGTGGDGGTYSPVVLDLTGQGIKITPLSSSNMFFDMANDGYEQQTAWAGAGNGVLVYDPSGGAVTQANQVDFTLWDPAAKTDMQALQDVFDTNHDGVLNASDSSWSSFRILVTNANGTTTLETLAQAGVTAINLQANAYQQSLPDGSSIDGETTFTRSNGTTGTAATVSFAASGDYVVQQTVTLNAAGATVLENSAYTPDGQLAEQITTTTSANGLDRTITFDWNGDGIVNQTETDDTVDNSGGSTTETVTDTNGSGVVLDSTTTTTSANGLVVTIDRDPTGAGYTAEQEVVTTVSGGGSTDSVSDLTRNGSLIDQTVSTVSANGLTNTTQVDSTGNGTFDLTETDQTVVAGTGVRTETVTDSNADNSMRSQTIAVTSANGLTTTTSDDGAGNGVINLVTVDSVVDPSGGGAVTTQTGQTASGTMLDQTVTTVSANGLTTTTQTDSAGNGVFNLTEVDATTVDSAGDRTETITDASANGTVYAESLTVHNAGGQTGSKQEYADYGSAALVLTQSSTTALNSTGALVQTVTDYSASGSDIGQTVTTTSANGLTVTTQVDPSGGGVYELTTTDATVENSNGSSTVTDTETAANGALVYQSVKTTSANGLSVVTQEDNTGNGTFDTTVSDVTTDNAGGSVTETVTTTSANGTLLGEQITVTSADRSTLTTTTENGDGQTVQVDTNVTAATGIDTDTLVNYAPNGSVIDETVTTTSGNGLSVTTQTDDTGAAGVFNLTTTDVTTIAANGSTTETVTDDSSNGTQLDQTVTTTSANGLSVTTTSNVDGKVDSTTTDVTVLNADGSSTETVTDYSNNNTQLSQTVTTTSFNGLSETATDNLDGNIDITTTDVTVLNANGSQTETVTDHTGTVSGTVRHVTTTTTGIILAGQGDETTFVQQSNGSVAIYQAETIETSAANGTVTDTTQYYAASGGPLLRQTATATSANGLVKTYYTAVNGDTAWDFWTADTTVYKADGSTTQTVAASNKSGLVDETVTTVSASGLSKTTSTDANGALNSSGSAVFNFVTTDNTVLNSDGSETKTVTDTSANGSVIDRRVVTTSADRKTVTTNRYLDETGTIATADQTETVQTQASGSVTDTTVSYNASHTLIDTTVVTTSGNDLVKTTTYTNGSGTETDSETDTETFDANGDGGTLNDEEHTEIVGGATLTSSSKTQTSGNDQTATITLALTGALAAGNTASFTAVARESRSIAVSGVITETTADTLNGASTVSDTTTVVTSANGLSTTTSTSLGSANPYIVTTAATNPDGSETTTSTYYNSANTALIEEQGTTVASWDGRTVTTTSKSDFDGTNYTTQTDTTVKNANGTETQTRIGTGSWGAGAFNVTTSIVTNADASVTTTVVNRNAASTTIGQMVTAVSVHTLGGVVQPAQALLTVVPGDGPVLVEATVENSDIGFVHAGQDVEVKVRTFEFTRYGLVHGHVVDVSRDRVVEALPSRSAGDAKAPDGKAEDAKGAEPGYVAHVALDTAWMLFDGRDEALSPGMAVTAEIKTGRRSVISYLLSPLRRYVHEGIRER